MKSKQEWCDENVDCKHIAAHLCDFMMNQLVVIKNVSLFASYTLMTDSKGFMGSTFNTIRVFAFRFRFTFYSGCNVKFKDLQVLFLQAVQLCA